MRYLLIDNVSECCLLLKLKSTNRFGFRIASRGLVTFLLSFEIVPNHFLEVPFGILMSFCRNIRSIVIVVPQLRFVRFVKLLWSNSIISVWHQ